MKQAKEMICLETEDRWTPSRTEIALRTGALVAFAQHPVKIRTLTPISPIPARLLNAAELAAIRKARIHE